MNKKIIYGQFFTKQDVWLKKHIKDFILNTKTTIAYDPFAGNGDLLNVAKELGYKQLKGLDIDNKLHWNVNDSLINIPKINNAIIITNPPYISNYSASRKGIVNNLQHYFKDSIYDDVYLIALDKMLEAQEFVVAIIPETFINSNYKNKNRLYSITILEDNPFTDTDTPVIVACFDGKNKKFEDINVYKNDKYINNLGNIEKMRLFPNKDINIIFNDKNGWLGIRCVDSTNPNNMLKFDFKENINYDWENGIKKSSRLFTLVNINLGNENKSRFIEECNSILNDIRITTDDIILSPFKGNMKNGKRRRRLDFLTCRAILEKAYYKINNINVGDLSDAT